MNKHIVLILFGALILAIAPSSLLAWGENGHRITAEIAQRNLSPKALTVIRSILGEESLAEIATWPDDIRSDPTWDFVQPWHFLSIDDDETWEGLKRSEDGDLLTALEMVEKFLRDPAAKSVTISGRVKGKGDQSGIKVEQKKEIGKREALAFYVHFIGDLHQPLHVGRRDDQGGNKIQVNWFGEDVALHKVWDESLIESTHLSFTEFATFLDRVPKADRDIWSRSGYLDWAKESKEVRAQVYDFGAQKSGYFINIQTAPSLSYDYRHRTLPVLRDRLAKGGIRLAGKMNSIFSGY